MTDYFVRKTGSDSNSGSSKTQAWLTLNHALNTCAGGDNVYVGAGVYRELIPSIATFASLVHVIGDFEGVQTGDAGEVRWTSYLNSDKDMGAGGALLTLGTKGNVAFSNMTLIGTGGNMISSTTGGGTNVSFTKCCLINIGGGITQFYLAANQVANIVIDKCVVLTTGSVLSVSVALAATTDFNYGCELKNSLVFLCSGGTAMKLTVTGAGTGKPGGPKMRYNTVIGGTYGFLYMTANGSLTYPAEVSRNIMIGVGTGIGGQTVGQVVEDYNYIVGVTAANARTNVTPGTHTVVASSGSNSPYSTLLELGQAFLRNSQMRMLFAPTADSPLLNWSDDATVTDDLFSRPRPAGGGATWGGVHNAASDVTVGAANAVGALERGNSSVKETSTVQSGSSAISFRGPGYHEFQVPVDPISTQFSIYCRYDDAYTGPLPEIEVLANGAIGLASQSAVATVAAHNGWEQVVLPSFTPTAKGVAIFRARARDTGGTGKTIFDSFGIAA